MASANGASLFDGYGDPPFRYDADLLGRNGVRVTAQTWNPGVSNTDGDMNAFVWIEFEGGVRVNYTGTFASPGTDTGWNGAGSLPGRRHAGLESARRLGSDPPFPSECRPVAVSRDALLYTAAGGLGEPITADSIGPTGHHYDLYHWRACIESQVERRQADVTICIRWH